MKTLLTLVIVAVLSIAALSASAQTTAPLTDMGGKFVSLYGVAEYKAVKEALASQNLVPVPFTEDLKPAFKPNGEIDVANTKYAVLGMVFYQAMYAFAPEKATDLLVQPKLMPQFVLLHMVLNPAAINLEFKSRPDFKRFNPDLPGVGYSHLYTSDAVLHQKGNDIWGTPWQMGTAGDFKLKYNKNAINKTSAHASFYDASESKNLLASVKMGKSKTIPTVLKHRHYPFNVLTSGVAKDLYMIDGNDSIVERSYDASADSYQVSGTVKEYFDAIGFAPILWQNALNWNSRIYLPYDMSYTCK